MNEKIVILKEDRLLELRNHVLECFMHGTKKEYEAARRKLRKHEKHLRCLR